MESTTKDKIDTKVAIDTASKGSPELSMNTALKIYLDATQTIRHYDGERTATHRLAVAVLGALFAFSGSMFYSDEMLTATVFVGFSLSLLFLLITTKHAALVERERARARGARDLMTSTGCKTILDIDSRKINHIKNGILKNIRLSYLWSLMYVAFTIGFILLFINAKLSH